jgi:hypothetical protein
MTDTLLCIGGPCDGRRPATLVKGSQTLILYVRPHIAAADGIQPVTGPSTDPRAIYSRETIHFGLGADVDFWVHESMSTRDALLRLIERYPGAAE